MRRRRKRNGGARWTIALIAVAALAWFGRDYWMAYLPSHQAPNVQPIDSVATAPAELPPASSGTTAGLSIEAPAATPTATATFMSEAEARDAAARDAREQTLKVQKGLRDAQQARKDEVEAAKSDKATRCIGGQKMKRVDNGWVQAGTC